MQKVMITGSNGMLGRTLMKMISEEVIGFDLPKADITNYNLFRQIVKENLSTYKDNIMIHCAAMTDVDNCEYEKDLAYKINAIGSMNVAKICNEFNIKLIAISTNYVFDGTSNKVYNEFDIANGGPTIYGKSKFAGEELIKQYCPNHIIVRTAWLYGPGGPSFIHTLYNMMKNKINEIKVVNDQIGNPTSVFALSTKIEMLMHYSDLTGIVHCVSEGYTSKDLLAYEFFKIMNYNMRINPCTSDEYYFRAANRPKFTALDNMQLRLYKLPKMWHWKEQLKAFCEYEFLKDKHEV